MQPWVSKDDIELDVTDEKNFKWNEFFPQKAEHYINKSKIKIDVYDQVQFTWDDFIDYCWTFKHKYQRQKQYDELMRK